MPRPARSGAAGSDTASSRKTSAGSPTPCTRHAVTGASPTRARSPRANGALRSAGRARSSEARFPGAHDRAQRLVVRGVEPQLVTERDHLAVDHVDLRAAARQVVETHRRAGV